MDSVVIKQDSGGLFLAEDVIVLCVCVCDVVFERCFGVLYCIVLYCIVLVATKRKLQYTILCNNDVLTREMRDEIKKPKDMNMGKRA